MPQPSVVVVSRDEDFHGVLAEQIKRELSADVRVVENAAAARAAEAACLVATEPLPGKWAMPVIAVQQGKDTPLRMHVLLTAIQEALSKAEDSLSLGECTLSLSKKIITQASSGKSTGLTDKETQLLAMLIKGGDKGVSKETLLRHIWGVETELESHTLETHIYRLRTKLRDASMKETIVAQPGSYKIETL